MSGGTALEMTSYTPTAASQSNRVYKYVTYWDLFETAAKEQYGDDIRVIRTPATANHINKFGDKLELLEFAMTAEPRETKRTITDVNLKEYTNDGHEGEDETVFKVVREVTLKSGERYHFSATDGTQWDIGGNLGLQVMGMGMAGLTAGISGKYGKSKSTTSGSETSTDREVRLSYEQEERIKVPPLSHVKVKITSYQARYEQPYIITLGVDSSYSIPLVYKTRCQQMCFGRNVGAVNVTQMLSSLHGYKEEGNKATIKLVGNLSWTSDGFGVEKEVVKKNNS